MSVGGVETPAAAATTPSSSSNPTDISKRKLSQAATSDDSTAKKPRNDETSHDETTNGVKDSTTKSTTTTTTTTTISLTKPKPKTVHVDLLLAFTYFDTNRTSHILESELETMLLRFGPLNLTRSKIRPLIKKLTIRPISDSSSSSGGAGGVFNYRMLTDKSPSISNSPLPVCFRIPTDDEIVQYSLSFETYMRRIGGHSGGGGGGEGSVSEGVNLVEINGTVIDVANTLKKLEKAQSDLHSFDIKFKEAQEEIGKFFFEI